MLIFSIRLNVVDHPPPVHTETSNESVGDFDSYIFNVTMSNENMVSVTDSMASKSSRNETEQVKMEATDEKFVSPTEESTGQEKESVVPTEEPIPDPLPVTVFKSLELDSAVGKYKAGGKRYSWNNWILLCRGRSSTCCRTHFSIEQYFSK